MERESRRSTAGNNFGEVRQAKLLARKQTEIEQSPRSGVEAITISTPGWSSWLTSKYGGNNRGTLESYLHTWRPIKRYLDANGLDFPASNQA